jgi:hypothetical protein
LHDAARRQASFTDLPALKFPPVVHRRSESYGRCLDVGGTLAVQDADGHLRCPASELLRRDHRASNEALAKIAVEITEYGRVCTLAKSRQHAIVFVWYPSCINPHACIEEG